MTPVLRMPRFKLMVMLFFFALSPAAVAQNTSPRVTYSREIAPILQEHCQTCHRPGEAAPMSLLSFAEVRPWAKQIRQKVSAREMPPWHANPAVGAWKNDRSLSDPEIEAIVSWVDQGANEGDPADLPPPAAWADGWTMGEPDLVFPLVQEQVLPADLIDEYRYLVVPMNLAEDVWIDAVEVRPGNREVVHHVNVFETSGLYKQSPEAAKELAEARERNRDDKGNPRNMSGEGVGPQGEPLGRVGGFLPGGGALVLAEGEGIRLPKGASLLLQVHYHKETGEEARDRTKVGVRLAKGPVQRQLLGGAVDNCQFRIPAGAAHHEVAAQMPIREDILVTAMSPHMHLRGKSFEAWADLPDGSRLDILDVPRYDFNWQTTYEPMVPIALPKGSVLRARAFFDNSSGNPFNPDPSIDVMWGEPTTDEMMMMFFRYTLADSDASTETSGDD